MNPLSKFDKQNLSIHQAFMLDQLKHEGPQRLIGAHMFDDVNVALELEALGWAVVYIKPGTEFSNCSAVRYHVRMTTRKERRAVQIAAYQAAHQAKVADDQYRTEDDMSWLADVSHDSADAIDAMLEDMAPNY